MNANKPRTMAYFNLCKLLDYEDHKHHDTDIPIIVKNINNKYQNIYNSGRRRPEKDPPPSIQKKKINAQITSLKDIIDLCDKYPPSDNIEYNIDMKSIHAIKDPLIELNNMIGMKSFKESILDQILYFILKFINNLK